MALMDVAGNSREPLDVGNKSGRRYLIRPSLISLIDFRLKGACLCMGWPFFL